MMLQGIKPPPIGTPQERIVFEAFIREKIIEKRKIEELVFIANIIVGVRKEGINPITKSLERLFSVIMYQDWMSDTKEAKKTEQESQLEILERVNRLRR